MAKTGVVQKPFPYAVDGVNVQTLAEGQVISFPDGIFAGLAKDGYIAESDSEPDNSVEEAVERDAAISTVGVAGDATDRRLMAASDQELKDIIARSGTPVSGNLVHANLVEAARTQLKREASGKKPKRGVDPNSGVTEQPLAAPGAATPPSAAKTVEAAQAAEEAPAEAQTPTDEKTADAKAPTNQFGDELPASKPKGKAADTSDAAADAKAK